MLIIYFDVLWTVSKRRLFHLMNKEMCCFGIPMCSYYSSAAVLIRSIRIRDSKFSFSTFVVKFSGYIKLYSQGMA